jgi:outer membrane receptor protein involved in Fe transport
VQGSLNFDRFFYGGRSWLDGTVLRVGVVNLFNKLPAFSESAVYSAGYDVSTGDIRGRFGYIELSKAF